MKNPHFLALQISFQIPTAKIKYLFKKCSHGMLSQQKSLFSLNILSFFGFALYKALQFLKSILYSQERLKVNKKEIMALLLCLVLIGW